ncbi:MAG TPA: hypothetical protein EYH03_05520 [Chromatiales bacterium]|nr:hypothetical protein [Piscirickettsiaceae bacterium]HIP53452.1 hypothetical protein [Chromatiales bacterium]
MSESTEGNLFDTNSLAFKTTASVTFTLSAGYVSWLITSGSLTASMLSLAPLWMQFDPIPVVSSVAAGTGAKALLKQAGSGRNTAKSEKMAEKLFD